MTNKDAISRIKTIADASMNADRIGLFEPKPITTALYMAIDALEKRTKKMVTHEATLYKPHTCPACKNVIDEFADFFGDKVLAKTMFCKYCGQALDWGDE